MRVFNVTAAVLKEMRDHFNEAFYLPKHTKTQTHICIDHIISVS